MDPIFGMFAQLGAGGIMAYVFYLLLKREQDAGEKRQAATLEAFRAELSEERKANREVQIADRATANTNLAGLYQHINGVANEVRDLAGEVKNIRCGYLPNMPRRPGEASEQPNSRPSG